MWALVVFWILIVPLIILLAVVYGTGRKLYRLLYILSVFTYAMTVMYAIDAFELGRNAIILLLAFSSLLMILLGLKFRTKKRRRK
ncbi:hypothetical protein KY329_03490 [Candidatus Woesearchaeota archaeon]|nr:hypothetical protein [Candidatus Woesearchaeota archaeon]